MGAAAPMIIMAAAAAAQTYNTQRTAKKKDQAAAEGIRKQGEMQREANARMGETLKTFETPATGKIRDSLRSQYGDAARFKMQQAMANLEQVGATSGADKKKTASAEERAAGYGGFFADEYGKLDAPGDTRRLEAYAQSDLGSDLTLARRNSAAEDYLTRMRVGGIQRNPWIDMGAAVANGIAGGMGSGTMAGAASLGDFGNSSPQQFLNSTSGQTFPGMSNGAWGFYGKRPSGVGMSFGG